MRPYLGTFVEIGLNAKSSPATDHAFIRAFERIELIQNLLSFHSPDSDLSRLNRARGLAVECHPLSLRCLRLAKNITSASGGLFNCTLGAGLVKRGILPDHHLVTRNSQNLLDVGIADDLAVLQGRAQLKRPVFITLDGIAKGFAIDCAIQQIKMTGIKNGWINAGGDLRVFGDWIMPVSVRDHLGREHVMGGIHNAAIATSTSLASDDYPGMLLSASGENLQAGTWSVLAHFAWRADALTKVAANLPDTMTADKRIKMMAELGGRYLPVGETFVDQ